MIVRSELDVDGLNDGLIDIELIENDVVNKKTISFEDYCESIKPWYFKIIDKKKINIDVTSDMLKIMVRKNKLTLLFKIDRFNLFLIHNNKSVIWKLPTIICECTEDGQLRFWCCKTKKVNSDTKLYRLNLPHHYSDGTVCYGSFKTHKVAVDEMKAYAIEYLQTAASHQLTENLLPGKEKNEFQYVIYKNDYYRKLRELPERT